MKRVLNGLYQKYGCGLYVVTGCVKNTGTDEEMVLYHVWGDPSQMYVYPVTDWDQHVVIGEYSGPRFRPIDGVAMVQQERENQIAKGYDAIHDNNHADGELPQAAAACLGTFLYGSTNLVGWPWPDSDNRLSWSKLKLLSVAGALIIAELDRRLRGGETP